VGCLGHLLGNHAEGLEKIDGFLGRPDEAKLAAIERTVQPAEIPSTIGQDTVGELTVLEMMVIHLDDRVGLGLI
jgi:ABC-type uncharacterized transport system YnjBCD ATPase subunit